MHAPQITFPSVKQIIAGFCFLIVVPAATIAQNLAWEYHKDARELIQDGRHIEALKLIEDSVLIRMETLPDANKFSVYELQGLVLNYLSRYAESIKVYEKARSLSGSVTQASLVKLYLNYALNYWHLADYDRYYNLTKTALEMTNDKESYRAPIYSYRQQNIVLGNLMEYHEKISGNWQMVVELSHQLQQNLDEMNQIEEMDPAIIAAATAKQFTHRGVVFRERSHAYDEAIRELKAAIALKDKMRTHYPFINAQFELAKTYFRAGQPDSATTWLQRIANYTRLKGDPVNLLKAQARLLQIGIRTGDEEMIANTRRYINEYQDEIYSEEIHAMIDLAMIELNMYRGRQDRARTIAANLVDRLPRMDGAGYVVGYLQYAIDQERLEQESRAPSNERIRSAAIEMLLAHEIQDPFLKEEQIAWSNWLLLMVGITTIFGISAFVMIRRRKETRFSEVVSR